MLDDIREYDATKNAISNGMEELIPSEVVFALMDGENPIRIWREYRKLSQNQLAEAVGISIPYLSQLETGKRKASIDVISKISSVLKLEIDDLVKK